MSVDTQRSNMANQPTYMEVDTIQEVESDTEEVNFFSVASKSRLPIISITIGKKRIRCLIDTGSTISILKINTFTEQFPETKLEKPEYFKTLNGLNEVKSVVTTPFPKEFKCLGTLKWKLVDFANPLFSGIIGQNFLKALRINIYCKEQYIDALGTKLYFEEYNYPTELENICTLESLPENDNELIKDFNLSHLNFEESQAAKKLLLQFKDLFF